MTRPEFGDTVCIVDTPLTRARGFAGLHGVVYGFTTPSATGVAVIGNATEDAALNVHFESRNEAFWFAPELVQFVDHGAGSTVTVDGVDKKLVRRADGGWDEISTTPTKRPWWKFWTR
ncbi:MAG TPA: hypothetical protein VFB68_18910 [Xanthobacteraceae bacterium]|nr:hypothetical protein [Xanthobacteraceae bacterium]